MLIQDTSVTVTYKKIEDIKKIYDSNKNVLEQYFKDVMILPIPDDAPLEIPRIILKSQNGHAQLNISPVATTFGVQYNAGYEKNWNECALYVSTRMRTVFDFLNRLTNDVYEYVGVVTNVIYDEVSQNGTEKLASTLLKSPKIKNLFDINLKYTFIEESSLFVNIMLQNARFFKDSVDVNEAGSLNINDQVAESIGACIDINDRYAFNTDVMYKSNSKLLSKLLVCMNNIINNKLQILIEKGEY